MKNQPVFWEIQYKNGLIHHEDIITPIGDGGYKQFFEDKKTEIKTVSLITPYNRYDIDIETGRICGDNLYRDGIELTNRNMYYEPFQYKEGFLIEQNGEFKNLHLFNIGWIADFKDFKIKTRLSVNGITFKPSIYVEEVVD